MGWLLYEGNGSDKSHQSLPPAPPWRDFDGRARDRAQTFRVTDEEVQLVNAAIYLRRPLLVTGPPGSGKSSLIHSVAAELGLGEVLVWPINSRSTLSEGLYRYDAVARLRDANQALAKQTDNTIEIERYLTLGPLGTALLPGARPRALLIDEIDKSDVDLPNDLLHVFEEGYFEIPELKRIAAQHPEVSILTDGRRSVSPTTIHRGAVQATEFPFTVITSNGERDLPPAFLRRCLRLDLKLPDQQHLIDVVQAHLGTIQNPAVDELIREFLDAQSSGRWISIDQLLNSVFLLIGQSQPENWSMLKSTLMRALNEE